MPQFVRVEVDRGVGVLRLERPPHNAITLQSQSELRSAVDEVTERRDVNAVVVYGGDRAFSIGADIAELAALSFQDATRFAPSVSATFTALAEIPKPTVAAISGYALGGGYELALCCDRRIAGDDAIVGLPEVQLGLIPGSGGTQRLSRLVGLAWAKELIFSGRLLEADDALGVGLLDELVAPEDVLDAAHHWAARFVGGPGPALSAAKLAIDSALSTDLATGLRLECQLFAGLFASEDGADGLKSRAAHHTLGDLLGR